LEELPRPINREDYMSIITSMSSTDLILRLVVAVLVGGLFGLNRDFNRKSAGLRTHALVTLGAAMATIAVLNVNMADGVTNADAVSRVLQGILTGIGFLGAGVIIRDVEAGHITGLTTAATIWVSAVIGTFCGLGYWLLIGVSALLVMAVLMFGGTVEKFAKRVLKHESRPPQH
jgi:putative Mg2+ transporter-C (MgtC) family protein